MLHLRFTVCNTVFREGRLMKSHVTLINKYESKEKFNT
jgi:hypothetical protein